MLKQIRTAFVGKSICRLHEKRNPTIGREMVYLDECVSLRNFSKAATMDGTCGSGALT